MFYKCSLLALALYSMVLVVPVHAQNECCEEQLNVARRTVQNKSYHVVSSFRTNFFTAVEYCRYIGMNLASIETAVQQNALWSYITSLGLSTERFWISGNDLGHEGRFVWLNTGLPLIYRNFMAGQPDNAGGNENCLELKTNGRWNDFTCLSLNFFVCQF